MELDIQWASEVHDYRIKQRDPWETHKGTIAIVLPLGSPLFLQSFVVVTFIRNGLPAWRTHMPTINTSLQDATCLPSPPHAEGLQLPVMANAGPEIPLFGS